MPPDPVASTPRTAIFPASYSTLDTVALASLVSDKYELKDTRCRLLLRGVGDTYLVDAANGRFILRAYRASHRSLSQIEAEMKLLVELKHKEVPVSYPIADLSGQYIQTLHAVEGDRQVVLFSFAPGRSVSRMNERQLRELGRQMARFHDVSSSMRLVGCTRNFDTETTLFGPLDKVKPFFREDPEGYAWLEKAVGRVAGRLARMDTSGFSSGYCQFDFLPKNFHFEGDAVTFFDFDFLGYGWLVNDIMTFWQHLCLDVHNKRIPQEEADTAYAIFLNSYREVRPLGKEELDAVPWIALGFWLFYMEFHTTHDQFYQFIEPAHLKLRVAGMRLLLERHWDAAGE